MPELEKDRSAKLAALRRRAAGLRDDVKRRPHLRYTLESMIDQLEQEALELEKALDSETGRAA